MKAAKLMRAKQVLTTAPKAGKKQSPAGMGGMFGNVTKKKPEPDNFAPKKSDTRAVSKARKARLEGVKL